MILKHASSLDLRMSQALLQSLTTITGLRACSVAKLCLTLVTPWTAACQALLSMRFSRQESRSGLPCPPPRYLPDPGIAPPSPASSALQAESLSAEPLGKATVIGLIPHLSVVAFLPLSLFPTPILMYLVCSIKLSLCLRVYF